MATPETAQHYTIILLTHSRELTRETNTGQAVRRALPDTRLITWDRVNPDSWLFNAISQQQVALLYPEQQISPAAEGEQSPFSEAPPAGLEEPSASLEKPSASLTITPSARSTDTKQQSLADEHLHCSNSSSVSGFRYFVILDATWQEARKMFNKSPYLQNLTKVSLAGHYQSIYQLRRNQVDGGLCTAECAAYLLSELGELDSSQQIFNELHAQLKVTPRD